MSGGAEQTTAGKPLIVVMPNIDLKGNGGGWCTDWPNGQQKWETFHIGQFLPWVDQNLRTIRSRGTTILLVEHNMKAVMGTCERIVVLNFGQKLAEGTPAEVSANASVIEAYLGAGLAHA